MRCNKERDNNYRKWRIVMRKSFVERFAESFDRPQTNLKTVYILWRKKARRSNSGKKITFVSTFCDKLVRAKGQQLLRLFKVVCIIISILNCWIVNSV